MLKRIFLSVLFFLNPSFSLAVDCFTKSEIENANHQTFCLNTDSAFECGLDKPNNYLKMGLFAAIPIAGAAVGSNMAGSNEKQRLAELLEKKSSTFKSIFEPSGVSVKNPLEASINTLTNQYLKETNSGNSYNSVRVDELIKKYEDYLAKAGISLPEIQKIDTAIRKYFDVLQTSLNGHENATVVTDVDNNMQNARNAANGIGSKTPEQIRTGALENHPFYHSLKNKINESYLNSNINRAIKSGRLKGGLAGATVDLAIVTAPSATRLAKKTKCQKAIKSTDEEKFIDAFSEFDWNCNLNVTDAGWVQFLELKPEVQLKSANISDQTCKAVKLKMKALDDLSLQTSNNVKPEKISCAGKETKYQVNLAGKTYKHTILEKNSGYEFSSTFTDSSSSTDELSYNKFSIGIDKNGLWQSAVSPNLEWRKDSVTNKLAQNMSELKKYTYENKKCELIQSTNHNLLRLSDTTHALCSIGKQIIAAQKSINQVLDFCATKKLTDQIAPATNPGQNLIIPAAPTVK